METARKPRGVASEGDEKPSNLQTTRTTVKEETPDSSMAIARYCGNEKQVRFGNENTDNSTTGDVLTDQQPQHRYVSPSRSMSSSCSVGTKNQIHTGASRDVDDDENGIPTAVLEYKTYRSPDRSTDGVLPQQVLLGSDGGSPAGALLVSSTPSPTVTAASVSVDQSDGGGPSDSPLAHATSHDDDSSDHHQGYNQDSATTPSHTKADKRTPESRSTSSRSALHSQDQLDAAAETASHCATDYKFMPNSPKSSSLPRETFEEKKGSDEDIGFDREMEHHAKYGDDVDGLVPQTPRSRDNVTTPTDFADDYGKGSSNCNVFDTSNVLAWLQSPTAHGLFSPGGGLGSLMNTPAGSGMPRTPRTPTVSTSFFFSDVASLPKSDGSPRQDGGKTHRGGGSSNIICISPLASTRGRPDNVASAGTPLNFRDIFASPKTERGKPLPLLGDTPCRTDRHRGKARRGARGDPSLDAVHLAERDLLEDEDLSVLLQLAANTPGSKPSSNGAVFRSPPSLLKKAEGSHGDGSFPGLELPMIGNDTDGEGSNKARLQQKSGARNGLGNDAFGLPQLGMRSSSSHGSSTKESNSKSSAGGNNDPKDSADEKSKKEMAADSVTSSSALKSSGSSGAMSNANPYHMAPPYPPGPADMHAYYPMAGMPQCPPNSTGSMRVVVGGHPPSRRNSTGGSTNTSKINNISGRISPRQGTTSPPHYHEYPPHPGNLPYPPPPPGMFSTYPAYSGMGRYPPYSHYPPPRPMPMYNAQRAPSTSSSATASSKDPSKRNKTALKTVGGPGSGAVKSAPQQGANKRSSPSSAIPPADSVESDAVTSSSITGATGNVTHAGTLPSPNKKPKKSPGDRPTKKKNRSPPLTDRGDREKAAATIHSVNQASGGKNDRAAALAAAILRGVTMRPSGKWQAQLYFAGKSRYIGVFDTREKAALAYEIAREKLKSGPSEAGGLSAKSTENLVNTARKAAFDGVNERLPK
ncbi:hypothetical protein ACA910_019136 [Epithemia clementina (nom. ined.)]